MQEDIVLGNKSESNNKKMYMFSFNGSGKDHYTEMFNSFITNKYITYWRTDMSNSFYIVSTLSLNKIRDYIHDANPTLRFLLVEMINVGGWITKESWEAIDKYTNKKTKPTSGIISDKSTKESEIEI